LGLYSKSWCVVNQPIYLAPAPPAIV
jgi:hypothetical protein